jgi:hypothetical protein
MVSISSSSSSSSSSKIQGVKSLLTLSAIHLLLLLVSKLNMFYDILDGRLARHKFSAFSYSFLVFLSPFVLMLDCYLHIGHCCFCPYPFYPYFMIFPHFSRCCIISTVERADDVTGDFILYVTWKKSRDSSVGIALGYGLDDRGSRVRFSAGAGNFSLHHRVQNGSGAHPPSYQMGTSGSFPGGKVAGA